MFLLYLLPAEEIEMPNHGQTVVLKHSREVRRCLASQCNAKVHSFSFHCRPRWWTRDALKQQVNRDELSLQKSLLVLWGPQAAFQLYQSWTDGSWCVERSSWGSVSHLTPGDLVCLWSCSHPALSASRQIQSWRLQSYLHHRCFSFSCWTFSLETLGSSRAGCVLVNAAIISYYLASD